MVEKYSPGTLGSACIRAKPKTLKCQNDRSLVTNDMDPLWQTNIAGRMKYVHCHAIVATGVEKLQPPFHHISSHWRCQSRSRSYRDPEPASFLVGLTGGMCFTWQNEHKVFFIWQIISKTLKSRKLKTKMRCLCLKNGKNSIANRNLLFGFQRPPGTSLSFFQ